MPSGTPMTPSGIWSSANAKLKSVSAPTPSRRREGRHDDERDLRRAEADRPRRHQQERLARLRVAASIRGV